MNDSAALFARCPLPKLRLGVMSGAYFLFLSWKTVDTDMQLGVETKNHSFFVLKKVCS